MRVISLLPAATEIVAALGAGGRLVGVTHECDYPPEVRVLPRVTRSRLDPDLARGEVGVETRTGHTRQHTHFGRIVALVCHADETPACPQGGHDLGGGGQQRNDTHPYSRRARMPKCREIG